MRRGSLLFLGSLAVAWVTACSSSNQDGTVAGAGVSSTVASAGTGGGTSISVTSADSEVSASISVASAGGGGQGTGGSGSGSGGPGGSGGSGGSGPVNVDTLDSNRDRLLETYFEYLKANAIVPQSNGLSSGNVTSICDVWSELDASARAVFLTLTARLQSSLLGIDGSSALWHVKIVYRIAGGQGAKQDDPGSSGGGEFNRMIMSMDAELQAAEVAANTHQGSLQPNGKYDIADAPPKGTFWRDSHDLAGPHGPFDLSDETDQGAPRAQTQYFKDPASALAKSPLGRQDLTTLVDPYALEFDQDYDCFHNSNPLCSYVSYGPFCLPGPAKLGTQIYSDSYGDYGATWKPSGCP